MRKVSDIFAIWPTDADLGRDIEMPYPTVSAWKKRESIPAAYWRDVITAARKRGHSEVTADLLVDLHARRATRAMTGFGEEERPLVGEPERRPAGETVKPVGTGHFSRFKHHRRSNFKTAEEIEEHIRALRDEWSHR